MMAVQSGKAFEGGSLSCYWPSGRIEDPSTAWRQQKASTVGFGGFSSTQLVWRLCSGRGRILVWKAGCFSKPFHMNIMGERSMSETLFNPVLLHPVVDATLGFLDVFTGRILEQISSDKHPWSKTTTKHYEVCDELDGGSLDL